MTRRYSETGALARGMLDRLPSGLAATTGVRLLGVAVSLASVVVLARMLGPDQYGRYAYAIALISVLSLPVTSGLPTLVVREAARAIARNDAALFCGIRRWSFGAVAVYSGLLIVVVVPVALLVERRFPGTSTLLFVIGLPLLPLLAWAAVRAAALTGLGRVALGQIHHDVLRSGVLLALLFGWWVVAESRQPSARVAMALSVVAAFCTWLIMAWLLGRSTPGDVAGALPAYRTKPWLTSLGPLAFLAGMQLINRYTDILTLGLFAPAEAVGIYRAVFQGALPVAFVLQVVNSVVAPRFAQMRASGDAAQLQTLATRSARLALLGALPATVVLVAFGGDLLGLVFGSEYAAGWAALSALAVGQLVNVAAGSVGLLLNMSGHERESARGMAIAAVVNVALNFALIPPFGMVGAALATSISLAVWNILLWRSVRRSLGVDSTVFALSIKPR